MPPFTEDLPFALQLNWTWCLGVPFNDLSFGEVIYCPLYLMFGYSKFWLKQQLKLMFKHCIQNCSAASSFEITWLYFGPKKRKLKWLIGKETCMFQEGFSRPGPPTSWQGASPSNGFEPHFSSTFGFFEDTESGFVLNISPQYLYKSEGETGPTPGRG